MQHCYSTHSVLTPVHVERSEVVFGCRDAVPWTKEPCRCIDTRPSLREAENKMNNKTTAGKLIIYSYTV